MKHNIERNIWVLIIGSGINTLGVFISLPLITIYGLHQLGLSVVEVGFLSGIWPVTLFLTSFFCGILAERWGYLKTLRLGLSLSVISFATMGISTSLSLFSISLGIFGLGKAMLDSSIRAAMVSLAKGKKEEYFFRMRYLFQNIGNVVGPLIGIIIYDKIIGYTFLLSSIMFLIFLLASYTLLRAQDFKVVKVDPISAKDTFSVLKDLNLQFWLLSSLFIVMAYGAYEALMPAVIIDSKNTRPAFGILVSLNALVVVLFQFIHIKYLKNLSLSKSISIGFGLLSIGFLFFIFEWQVFVMTIIATILVAIGEAILFPCFDIVMGKIAPDDKRAIYYGASSLSQVGFFVGPSVGGFLLSMGGQSVLFVSCTMFILISSVFFFKVSREKNFVLTKQQDASI